MIENSIGDITKSLHLAAKRPFGTRTKGRCTFGYVVSDGAASELYVMRKVGALDRHLLSDDRSVSIVLTGSGYVL